MPSRWANLRPSLSPFRRRRRRMLSILMAFHGATVSAQADGGANRQLEEVTVTGAEIEGAILTEQTVTGSRLGINVLDLPASVSSISGRRIELRGDANLKDALAEATGLTTTPSSGGTGYGYIVRGFSGGSSGSVLYDGVKSIINQGSLSYPFDTWNVERIEVLNGAASVLHGTGGIGAAVNVVPRKPSDTWSHTARTTVGSFDTVRTAVDSTGPISDALSYRFSLSHNTSDGHVALGDSSGIAASASLKYEASDRLDLTLFLDYADRHQISYNGLPTIDGDVDESRWHLNYSAYDSEIPFEDNRVTLVANWRGNSNLEIKSHTYYTDSERLWRDIYGLSYRSDLEMIERGFYSTWLQTERQLGNHTEAVLDHELIGLESTTSFGFEVVDLDYERLVDIWSATDLVDIYAPQPGTFPTNGTITANDHQIRTSQYAIFAENRLEVRPNLALVTGFRADYTDSDRLDLDEGTDFHKVYDPVSWRVGAVYSVSEQSNFYSQYSTAADAISNLCCLSASALAYELSEGKQIEIGFKSLLWDGRLEWTLAAYDIVKTNLLSPDPENPTVSIQVGQQSSRGIETSLAIQAMSGLRIELNGTTLEARYDEYYEIVGGERLSRIGDRPTNVPEEMGNVSVIWAPHPAWLLRAAFEYRGSIYSDAANTQRVNGYTLADFSVRWMASDDLAMDLRVNNAFDEFYAATTSGSRWVLGEPRSVEAAFTVRF